MAKYLNTYREFSEYMLGAFEEKINQQKDRFFKIYQNMDEDEENLKAKILVSLPHEYIVGKVSLLEIIKRKNDINYNEDEWSNEYEKLLKIKMENSSDEDIITLINSDELYANDLYQIIRGAGKDFFIRNFKKLSISHTKDTKISEKRGLLYETFSSYGEIAEHFDNYLGSDFENYKGYITGDDFLDIYDVQIDEYQVDSLYSELVKKYPEYKQNFENYINKNSDAGDDLYDIINTEQDEVYNAFSGAIVSGLESGMSNEIYKEFINCINKLPFLIIEQKEKNKDGYEYITNIEFWFSLAELYDLISKDSETFEEWYGGEDLYHVIKNSGEYEDVSFNAPYHGFEGYDEESALDHLYEELSNLDDEYWEPEEQLSESKYKSEEEIIWENYIKRC